MMKHPINVYVQSQPIRIHILLSFLGLNLKEKKRVGRTVKVTNATKNERLLIAVMGL